MTFFKPSLSLFQDFPCIAVVGLGNNNAGVCGAENWDIGKESVRQAVSGRTLDLAGIITDCMDGMCGVVVPSYKKKTKTKNACVFSWMSLTSRPRSEARGGGWVRGRTVSSRRCYVGFVSL